MKDEKIFRTKLVTKCSVLYDYIRKDKTRILNMGVVRLDWKMENIRCFVFTTCAYTIIQKVCFCKLQ